jgi:predicted O-methyltransferase YrrM
MNSYLKEILETGVAASPSGEKVPIRRASISRAEGEFIQSLILKHRPQQTLEVGMAYGVSSMFICDALAQVGGRQHTVIDYTEIDGYRSIGLSNVKAAGFDHLLEFFGLRSDEALPRLADDGRRIDFALIDGWHTFDYALVDFYYIDKMLNPGGIVALDDADWPAIRKLCRYIATNLNYSVILPPKTDLPLKLSAKRRFLDILLRLPTMGPFLRRVMREEMVNSDKALGLGGSMIAFRKEAEDSRRSDFHKDF